MAREITRRDFINGAACTVAAAGARLSAYGRALTPGEYPPSLDGIRGSRLQDASAAHAVRDGMTYRVDHYPVSGTADCVIVGAGRGGLSAAYFLCRRAPNARILILDNHDDFGGHARRNEFQVDDRILIGYGGSESIQAPKASWSATARALLTDIGVHPSRFESAIDTTLYPNLGMSFGQLFQREVFGIDKLVTGDPQRPLPTDIPAALHRGRAIAEFAQDCPLPDEQRRSLVALYTDRRDLLPGKSRQEKRTLLARISYAEFLIRYWAIDAVVLQMYLGRTLDLFGLPADKVAAIYAADCAYPGFQGQGLVPSAENLEPSTHCHPGNDRCTGTAPRTSICSTPAAAP